MRTIILTILSVMLLANIVVGEHVINNDATIRKDWVWKETQRNIEMESEKEEVEGIIITLKQRIAEEGVESVVQNILATPSGVYVWSINSYLAVIRDDCLFIYHGKVGELLPTNFCETKNTIVLAKEVSGIKHNEIKFVKFNLDYTQIIAMNNDMVPVRFVNNMVGYAYKFERYIFLFQVMETVEIGTPKNLNPQPEKIFSLINDRIHTTQI